MPRGYQRAQLATWLSPNSPAEGSSLRSKIDVPNSRSFSPLSPQSKTGEGVSCLLSKRGPGGPCAEVTRGQVSECLAYSRMTLTEAATSHWPHSVPPGARGPARCPSIKQGWALPQSTLHKRRFPVKLRAPLGAGHVQAPSLRCPSCVQHNRGGRLAHSRGFLGLAGGCSLCLSPHLGLRLQWGPPPRQALREVG